MKGSESAHDESFEKFALIADVCGDGMEHVNRLEAFDCLVGYHPI